MVISENGHMYHVLDFDPKGKEPARLGTRLDFFKKIGDKFPGNIGAPMWGTNCQEVLRVLIYRVEYLQNQWPCEENVRILARLRSALYDFEFRAARIKDQLDAFTTLIPNSDQIEDRPFCNVCGHIYPHTHTEVKND